jgi:hypothetical protein
MNFSMTMQAVPAVAVMVRVAVEQKRKGRPRGGGPVQREAAVVQVSESTAVAQLAVWMRSLGLERHVASLLRAGITSIDAAKAQSLGEVHAWAQANGLSTKEEHTLIANTGVTCALVAPSTPVIPVTPVGSGEGGSARVGLPDGWEAQKSADGRTYYIDHINKVTQWDPPPSPAYSPEPLSTAARRPDDGRRNWVCPMCTLENTASSATCGVCGSESPMHRRNAEDVEKEDSAGANPGRSGNTAATPVVVAGSVVLWKCADGHENDPGNAQCVWCGKSRPVGKILQHPPGKLYPETKAEVNDGAGGEGAFATGDRIQARYHGGKKWFDGRVTKVNDTGTFNVIYDDGDEERDVTTDNVRSMTTLGARWECGACTVVNEATLGCCTMCAAPRPHNDAHLEASVPMSPFSLAITAQIDAQEARGADMDFALMGQLKSVDLPKARALDVAAHVAQVACAARKAELDAPLAAAMKAGDYERCSALQPGVKKAAAQLKAATDARAKAWRVLFPGRFCFLVCSIPINVYAECMTVV